MYPSIFYRQIACDNYYKYQSFSVKENKQLTKGKLPVIGTENMLSFF